MKKILQILVLTMVVTMLGCTTAGPFVTGISSDGRGNLIIEKSHVHMNAFMGTVSNEGGTTTTIRILPDYLSWANLRDALLAQEYQGRTTKKRLVEKE